MIERVRPICNGVQQAINAAANLRAIRRSPTASLEAYLECDEAECCGRVAVTDLPYAERTVRVPSKCFMELDEIRTIFQDDIAVERKPD